MNEWKGEIDREIDRERESESEKCYGKEIKYENENAIKPRIFVGK